jgi:hypothetical protein
MKTRAVQKIKRHYQYSMPVEQETYVARIEQSFKDVKAGKIKRGTAKQLLKEIRLIN